MRGLEVGQTIIMDMKVAEPHHDKNAQKLAGQIGHVTKVKSDGYYEIDIDSDGWGWSQSYIHPININCDSCENYNTCNKLNCKKEEHIFKKLATKR